MALKPLMRPLRWLRLKVKYIPRHAAWHWGSDCHLGFQGRVLEGDFVRMEAYRGVGVRARIAVFEVAFDWAADVCELTADLMMAASKQIYFKKIVIVGFANDAIS